MNMPSVSEYKKCYSYEASNKLNFKIVILGRLVSDLGSAIFNFALSLYILELTGSAGIFSIVLGFSILPQAIVNAFAGVFIDRGDKKRILITCELLSGLLVLIFLAVFHYSQTNIISFIVYTILLNSLQACFLLALNSAVPDIVAADKVEKANSAFQVTGAVVKIGGPLIGAIAYRTVGLETILLFAGISFLVAGLLKILLKFHFTEKKQTSLGFIADMTEVFAYIRSKQGMGFVFSSVIVINSLFLPLIFLVLPYVTLNLLRLSEIQLALIQGAWAAGAVLGAAVITLRNITISSLFRKIFLFMQLQALMIMAWVFPDLLPTDYSSKILVTVIFCLLLLIAGMLNAATSVAAYAFIQLKIDRGFRARVFGLLNSAGFIAVPLGMWLFGGLLETIAWTLLTGFAGSLLFLAAFYVGKHRSFQRFSNIMEV